MECETFDEFLHESLKLTNSDVDVFVNVYKTDRGRNIKGQLNSYYGLGLKSLRIDVHTLKAMRGGPVQPSPTGVSTTIRIKDLTERTHEMELRGFLLGGGWTRIGRTRGSAELI